MNVSIIFTVTTNVSSKLFKINLIIMNASKDLDFLLNNEKIVHGFTVFFFILL